MTKEAILANGFFFDNPREGAPPYVMGRISVRVGDAVRFLNDHANAAGYVNLDLLDGKNGKPYLKLNDWKPGVTRKGVSAVDEVQYPEDGRNPEDIPF